MSKIVIGDILKPTISEEYAEQVHGLIQDEVEEAKTMKYSEFLKFDDDTKKVLHVPERDESGELNVGRIRYRCWITTEDGKQRSISEDTKEALIASEAYKKAQKTDPIQKRHLLYVVEVKEGELLGHTWDLAKTHWQNLFTEYVKPDKTHRNITAKRSADGKGFVFNSISNEDVEEIYRGKNKK